MLRQCSQSLTSRATQHLCNYRVNATMSSFAVVDYATSYEESMQSRHGAQLTLAYHEVKKKPHPPIGFIPMDLYADENENEDIEIGGVNEVDDEDEVLYDNRGFPVISSSLQRAYKAGAPAGGSFAIIKMGGTQYKVCVDDVIISDKLKPVSKYHVGAELTLEPEDVLLLGSQEKTLVGLPFIDGAKVQVRVEELTRDAKVIIFKKRRRKNSRRKNGFKREVAMVRVIGIEFPDKEIDNNQ